MRPSLLLFLAPFILTADDAVSRWWSHVAFLADDSLEGRATGSAGHRKAAEYVADQLKRAGFAPCGSTGYLQAVPLESRRVVADKSVLELVRDGQPAVALRLGSDATLGARSRRGEHDAALAFAGYGLSIPSHDYDDLAGVDLKGKVAVYISGSPSHLPGPIRAHFSSTAVRNRALLAAGAVGVLAIPNPKTSDVPWARSVLSWNRATLAIRRGSPELTNPEPAVGASLNPELAGMLFDKTSGTVEELFELAAAGKLLPKVELRGRLRARVEIEESLLSSDNVCGILTGSDPRLKTEHVVLTAHLDHLGKAGVINGDAVYNGTMDNASGIATMIEAAHALGGARPKRSIAVVAVTAEENGHLGSRFFVEQALHDKKTLAANINMDMFLPIHAMKLWMVLGLDESTLRAPLERVAERLGLRLQADPEPHRNRFIRSDQYSFIRRGVPSVALKVGYEAGSPEATLQREWTRTRYHAPSDDLAQPVDRAAAVLFTRAVTELTREVANQPERPEWNESSYFRRFATPAAQQP
jgi:Zn-dependent M28 family amino/carboxypeptidase